MNSYILCATQPFNLGDLIINKMLIDELSYYGKVYIDTYGLPNNFKKYLLENKNTVDIYETYHFSLKRINLLQFKKLLKKENIKIFTRSPGPLYNLKKYKQLIFNLIYRIAQKSSAQVLFIGNCASSFLITQQKIKDTNISHLYLRSYESVNYVKQIYTNNVSYIPDLAFLLRSNNDKFEKKNKVAFNFRHNGIDRSIKEKCIKIINDFTSNGYQVELYYQVEKDFDFLLDLYKDIDNPSVLFRNKIVWYDDLNFYEDKTFVISNRLHSLIIGATYGAIPIVFSNNDKSCAKIKHVFDSSFQEYSNLFFNDFNQEIDVNKYIENQSTYANIVNNVVLSNKNICKKVFNDILSCF